MLDPALAAELSRDFPRLKLKEATRTSKAAPEYNCIAWAAGEDDRWWWPSTTTYWPAGAPLNLTRDAFASAFLSIRYEACASAALEPGFEKIALYVDTREVPTHAARQLDDGSWTSKLGSNVDLSHKTLATLEGGLYGKAAAYFRRPRR